MMVDEGTTIASLTTLLEVPSKGVAIALNGKVVPKNMWETTHITEQDNIVIIKAAYGG